VGSDIVFSATSWASAFPGVGGNVKAQNKKKGGGGGGGKNLVFSPGYRTRAAKYLFYESCGFRVLDTLVTCFLDFIPGLSAGVRSVRGVFPAVFGSGEGLAVALCFER